MKQIVLVLSVVVLLVMSSCSRQQLKVTVSNPSDFERNNEMVTVSLVNNKLDGDEFSVKEEGSNQVIKSQLVDSDDDGVADELIFMANLPANASKQFVISIERQTVTDDSIKTFARFAPERTDDFAWENDRVAFRTYGPEAQRMAEAGEPGGTLSSGIDCWLKKVDYSIINKWYQGNVDEPGYYHIDHGEGLDNYHVGPSRGCGGTGVMIDGQLYASKNFTSYKVLNNGPVQSDFVLEYEAYTAKDQLIKETKYVSIALGRNFTKYIIEVEGADTLTVGLTLHDKEGLVSTNESAGWINYHTPHKGEMLSSAIIAQPGYLAGTSIIESDAKDESHALMHLKVIDGKAAFYAGFNWSASKQFSGNDAWEQYLTQQANAMVNPIEIIVR
ncbi:DUF4861 family protein [Carboxylicivirga sediminis]|uniref:DUF4861 family protein n=1 Tax=Carboxylicivirga sediminis TaxID=2006564 RepID=A0A941F0P4_9BACT|nr:DUF4861 family protein [Carboxylicivirga sediminis]MBR8534686.1 DUF4861 family protein [Carboxylicivirga sediminis]